MSSRFYITLPSNSSMDVYPDNTVARYMTKLSGHYDLVGDWEVGLTEISMPTAVANVVEGHCYFDVYLRRRYVRRIVLEAGNHKSVSTLVDALNTEEREQLPLQSHESLLVEFSYVDSRIMLKFFDESLQVAIEFSPDLAHMLGFESDVKYSRNESAKNPTNLTGKIHSVFVYCDALEHVAVGDTKAPLLRIVDKPHRVRGILHQVFNPPQYVPLQKKNFDTLEINLMEDTGGPVPFLTGKSFVVLEFRRAVHSFLGI